MIKKALKHSVFLYLVLMQSAHAQQVGDTVYTCRQDRDGFMWSKGPIKASRAIVTQVLGRSFRIEYLNNYNGHYRGENRIVDRNQIFLPYQIESVPSLMGRVEHCKREFVEN